MLSKLKKWKIKEFILQEDMVMVLLPDKEYLYYDVNVKKQRQDNHLNAMLFDRKPTID